LASTPNLPDEVLAGLAAISKTDAELVLEFIRMLKTPGPNDHHVMSFISNHLFDPELRAQRGPRSGGRIS
jgi:hypothetical protein